MRPTRRLPARAVYLPFAWEMALPRNPGAHRNSGSRTETGLNPPSGLDHPHVCGTETVVSRRAYSLLDFESLVTSVNLARSSPGLTTAEAMAAPTSASDSRLKS